MVGAILALAIIGSAVSPPEDDAGGSDAATQSDSAAANGQGGSAGDTGEEPRDPEKPNEATSDATPRVGPNDQVTVDGLVWSIGSIVTKDVLGDPTIGTDEQADGVFVVAELQVHSTKGETVTLTNDVVQIEGGLEGAVYSADLDGTTAALLSDSTGAEPFFLEDLQPDTTTTGTVVFDVPPSVLGGDASLRFNELGFGETHAYISLR